MENNISSSLFTQQAIEISIKIAAIFLIISWCYQILEPFLVPVIWAAIIAVAVSPGCNWVQRKLGASRKIASLIVTLLMLAFLITPTYIVASKSLDSLHGLAEKIERHDFRVDPPAEKIKHWPFIGRDIFNIWTDAADNLESTLQRYEPQIRTQVKNAILRAADFGLTVLLFFMSIVISGFFMASSSSSKDILVKFSRRLAGDAGENFVNISGITIRNVTRGILGVALIQSLLAAIGLYLMDIPAAPLLAFCVLVLGIVQISPGLILIPVSIYAFSITDPTIATIFLIWNLLVGMLDNVLKPLLMGQGSSVPTLVIFLGAIGGFLWKGLIGLFVGAVIVVLGYELFLGWLASEDTSKPVEAD